MSMLDRPSVILISYPVSLIRYLMCPKSGMRPFQIIGTIISYFVQKEFPRFQEQLMKFSDSCLIF